MRELVLFSSFSFSLVAVWRDIVLQLVAIHSLYRGTVGG